VLAFQHARRPAGEPSGEAQVTIEIPSPDWANEEIADALKVQPLTGAEIVAASLTGDWKDEVTESGTEWVERTRRERHVKRRQ